MATYMVLSRFRDEALATIKDAPERSAAGRKAAEALGCKIVGSYLTMGHYDRVIIFEAPSDAAMAKAALALNVNGYELTETLRAFTQPEVAEIMASVITKPDHTDRDSRAAVIGENTRPRPFETGWPPDPADV